MEKESWLQMVSRNMGVVTGPLILTLGIVGYMRGANQTMSIFIIVLGAMRIALTIYSFWLRKKDAQQQD
ncbi:MAG: hypothetical protein IPI46_02765 [Bacteroidetes bacterium]|nr:hypothetical protein [Bacteroidota bacterium]